MRDADHLRVAKQGLDIVDQEQPQHRRGDEGDRDVEREAPRAGFAREQTGRDRPEGAPVEHDHGQDRAQLDDHVEGRPLLGTVAEQLGGEDQVPGRGDRQELGQSLDDAEQDRSQNQRHWETFNKAA